MPQVYSKIKMISNGRLPQNILCEVSLQPIIWSNSNFKLKLRWQSLQMFQMKTISNGGRPLNIRNWISQSTTQILHLSLAEHTKVTKYFKWRPNPMGTMTHIFHSVIILHYHCRSHCNIDIANILENFFKSDILAESSHPAVHTSDALRLLIIYKFGGFEEVF